MPSSDGSVNSRGIRVVVRPAAPTVRRRALAIALVLCLANEAVAAQAANRAPVAGSTERSAAAPKSHANTVAAAFDGTMRAWIEKYGVAANERVAVWSMSKAITALCLATLVQEHKLRFDDPIGPLMARAFVNTGSRRMSGSRGSQSLNY